MAKLEMTAPLADFALYLTADEWRAWQAVNERDDEMEIDDEMYEAGAAELGWCLDGSGGVISWAAQPEDGRAIADIALRYINAELARTDDAIAADEREREA